MVKARQLVCYNSLAKSLLVLVDEILGITLNCAYSILLSVTTQRLRTVGVLLATAVPQFSHHRINFGLENFSQLKKELILIFVFN